VLRDSQLGCSFFVGQAQVAWLATPDLPRVTRLWLPDRLRLEALEQSPVARRFFTFSSLDRLCFSASSHYPWVAAGSPLRPRVVQPGAWDRLEVTSDDGARLVRVFDVSPGNAAADFLAAPAPPVSKSWTELDALVAAVRKFLEAGVLP